MATAVFFHAHPDDEAIITGGTMLLASRAGHQVVLVCATDGSGGLTDIFNGDSDADDAAESAADDRLTGDAEGAVDGEGADDAGDLAERLAVVREAELRASAEILGVHRVEMLGYRDSGMAGDPANDDPLSFWQADDTEAAERLAALLREVGAQLVVCYDDNGNYGHPDHIKVHRVGVRAAEIAGVDLVYEATTDRDHFRETMHQIREMATSAGVDAGSDEEWEEMEDELAAESFGVSAEFITHRVDVTAALAEKRAAMAAHASQIPPGSFFVSLPDEAFALVSATEWYIQRGATPSPKPGNDIFAPLN